MLKTFTILLTVPEVFTASGAQNLIHSALQSCAGVDIERTRVDAFAGEHLTPGMGRGDVISAHAALRNPKPRTWADLTRYEQTTILTRASETGGGFVSRLADAWMRADGENSAKLGETFGAMLLDHFGGY